MRVHGTRPARDKQRDNKVPPPLRLRAGGPTLQSINRCVKPSLGAMTRDAQVRDTSGVQADGHRSRRQP